MKVGESLPYTREGLEALANTLKIHSSLMWFDGTQGRISFKQILPQRNYDCIEEEAE